MKNRVKLLAFYLPQYHEIPENNMWWGDGFTEWTNVKRGIRRFRGHIQPKIPLHHNYYDLSDPRVMDRQADLARKNGIDGFCFYHYYFTGKKLLERPVEAYLQKKKKLPYCLAWANQSWARTWYGKNGNNEILLRQTYGGEDQWKEHFNYLLPFFKDDDYIKIQGRPVFLIYLTQDFKACNQMINLWNQLAMEVGMEGIYFVAMDNCQARWFPGRIDATVDFEPFRAMRGIPPWFQAFRKERFDNLCTYRMVSRMSTESEHKCNIKKNFLGVFTGWDNTPRKDENGFVIRNSSPKKFEPYLQKQMLRSEEMGNELLFINAWNEWSEGAYLEPDETYGYAYLHAVRRVKDRCQ